MPIHLTGRGTGWSTLDMGTLTALALVHSPLILHSGLWRSHGQRFQLIWYSQYTLVVLW
jgi:hypothetical protein